jgi:hypothetical protein
MQFVQMVVRYSKLLYESELVYPALKTVRVVRVISS